MMNLAKRSKIILVSCVALYFSIGIVARLTFARDHFEKPISAYFTSSPPDIGGAAAAIIFDFGILPFFWPAALGHS